MKKRTMTLLLICLCLMLAGCGKQTGDNTQKETEVPGVTTFTYTDALGQSITFTEEIVEGIRSGTYKVAVLNGSFAEIWSLAGGKLAAVTEDAYDEDREISVDNDTLNAGELKSPNLETLAEGEIDLAILSADLEDQVALKDKLEELGIQSMYHSVEVFEDYLSVLEVYTALTGNEDAYTTYGEEVAAKIETQKARQDGSQPTVLFIRAYSTGAKAKGSDSMTGIMLKEMGCINIADEETSLADDLSMEVIVEKDPDYIFVTTMGSDTDAALNSVQTLLIDNPAWNTLTAVKEGHYSVLPKNMFQNKPNQRWGKSYEMLADILYPEN